VIGLLMQSFTSAEKSSKNSAQVITAASFPKA
jgi:hypothetical protein